MPELYRGLEIRHKLERVELDQHVVADLPLDAEASRASMQFGVGSELQGVSGDGQIRLATQSKVGAIAQADRDPLERRETGRRLERRMKASDRERERRRRS